MIVRTVRERHDIKYINYANLSELITLKGLKSKVNAKNINQMTRRPLTIENKTPHVPVKHAISSASLVKYTSLTFSNTDAVIFCFTRCSQLVCKT